MRALIVANSPSPKDKLLRIAHEGADIVIGADGGVDILWRKHLHFDLLIGDMDSTILASLEPHGLGFRWSDRAIEFPSDKDKTDTELAVEEAIKRGADEILMLGAIGGRIDHTIANIALAARHDVRILYHTNTGPVRLVTPGNPLEMTLVPETLVSLTAFAGGCGGVTTSGLKYALNDETLEVSGRGVENVALGEIVVSIEKGFLLVSVLSDDPALIWGNETMAGFDFSAVAESYDGYYESPMGLAVDSIEKDAVAKFLVDAKGYQSLIEVGSGTGHWSTWFSEKGYHVTGVDISSAMVNVANDKRLRGLIPNSRFVVGDIHNLDFPNNYFDVGAAITVLEFVDDPCAVISELARVVRPHGKLIIGALHEDSFLGKHRVENPDPIYTPAHFFRMDELEELLTPFGAVTIVQCLYGKPLPEFADTLPEDERKYSASGDVNGNFLVAEVKL